MQSAEHRSPRQHALLRMARRLTTPFCFAVVGTSGACVDLACFALLQLITPLPLARGLSIWLAMTWNYALNRRVTFADSRGERILRQYLLFCAACGAGAVVNWSVTVALCAYVGIFAAYPVAAAILGIGSGTVLNYGASRHFVFRPEPRPAESIAKSVANVPSAEICDEDPEPGLDPMTEGGVYARAE